MKVSKRVVKHEARELGRGQITYTLRPGKEVKSYSRVMGSHWRTLLII